MGLIKADSLRRSDLADWDNHRCSAHLDAAEIMSRVAPLLFLESCERSAKDLQSLAARGLVV